MLSQTPLLKRKVSKNIPSLNTSLNSLEDVDKKADDTLQEKESETISLIKKPEEVLDSTRYGDWEKNGRCIDF